MTKRRTARACTATSRAATPTAVRHDTFCRRCRRWIFQGERAYPTRRGPICPDCRNRPEQP